MQAEGDELLFLCTTERVVKRFAVEELVTRILPLLDGTRTVGEIAAQVGAESAELEQILDILMSERILSQVSDISEDTQALGQDRADYYDRQLRLLQDLCDAGLSDTDHGTDLQLRLQASTAVVCGLGGLGGEVARSLAMAGAGRIRVCDFDRVEVGNLTRQALFTVGDIGRSKAEVAAERLRAGNPHVEVEPVDRRIEGPDDLTDLVKDADLVISAADQPTLVDVAGWVSRACQPTIPHIVGGGYAYHVGVLGTTIIPGASACWECVRAETGADHGRDRASSVIGRRFRAGSMGALTGLVGNLVAWEAVRVLTGLPPAFADRWTELDFWSLSIQSRAIPRRADCPVCG